MKSLKGMDFKKLFVAHGEKVGLGVIVLIVLLALLTTSWGRFDRSPEDLVGEAETARSKITATEWPEPEQKNFVDDDDVKRSAVAMLSPIETARFSYTTEIIKPPYQRKEKIVEPDWLAVRSLVADSGRAVISLKAPETKPAQEQIAQADKPRSDVDEEIPEEFRMPTGDNRRARGNRAQGATPFRMSELAGKIQLGLGRREEEEYDNRRGTDKGASRPRPSATGFGRGERFVSVRGIVPFEDQVRALAKASHELDSEVIDDVEYFDFHLQRQKAIPGPDPWAGEWEDVDREISMEMLEKEVSGFEPDPLDPGVLDEVLTMPLPARVIGRWISTATHPDIENFTLSEDEIRSEMQIQEQMIEHYKKQQAQQAQDAPLEKRGFSGLQYGVRNIRRTFARNEDNLEDLARKLDPDSTNKVLRERIEKQTTAAGRLLLFRYIDFNVEPGNAYRYRVRLELINPNYGRVFEQIIDSSVGEGRTRLTPWSNPTGPVLVPDDTLYFVENVNPGRGYAPPSAKFDVFQWLPETGTVINTDDLGTSNIETLTTVIGSFIGGKSKTLVLDPAKGTFEREEVAFATDDVLLALEPRPDLDASAHPGLRLPRGGNVDIPEEVLLVDRYGTFKSVDSESPEETQNMAKQRLRWEQRPFQEQLESFREEEKAALDALLEEKYGRPRGGEDEGETGRRGYGLSPNRRDR